MVSWPNAPRPRPCAKGSRKPATKPALPECPEARFAKNLPGWKKSVEEGNKVSDLLAMLQSKYTLNQAQLDQINALGKQAAPSATAADAPAEMTAEQKAFVSELD